MIKHLACVMDGNRRWAKKRGLISWLGHREGLNTAKRVIDFCIKQSIPHLSLYTFSLENFKRPEQELHYLFNILIREMKNELLAEFVAKDVNIRFIGDRELFPVSVRPICEEIEKETAHLKKLHVQLLFCYGGRQEIVSGVKAVVEQVQQGTLDPQNITDEFFAQQLWTGDTPVPDVIVRTGGVRRMSNFLLYQAAYSELFFLDCMWPELTDQHLESVIESFKTCQRNFGV